MEMELVVDQVIGDRYRVEERLGSGAMGTVYRVRHVKLSRAFAIKVLHPPLTANDKLRKRFQREAEVAATLHHRNVVGVVDLGETDNLVYLVMELADGVPLSDIMEQAPMSPGRVIEYMRQLCDGLAHAHAHGLIHRDFKPDNVIVERDRAGVETLRIIDFGIAVLRDNTSSQERERLTTEGIVLGTPHYMAPEHASGEAIDHRIDLFALGVICFEMLTGTMPFEGDGVDVARSNMMFDTPAMSTRVPDLEVDPLLEVFTRRLMARNRDRRLASAKAARDILDLIANDRAAAAVALGLHAAPVAVPPVPAPLERPRLAIPAVSPRTRGAPNTLEPHVISTFAVRPPSQAEPSAVIPMHRRMRGALIGGGIAMLMLGVVLAASLSHRDEAGQIADTVASPDEPVAVLVAPPMPPPHRTIRAPERIATPPTRAPAIPSAPRPRPAKAITAPVAPRTQETPPVEAPPAADVAQLYGAVGRELGHLQQSGGSDSTLDLWPRFRHIRINDAIMTSDSRRETDRLLRELQRDIAARR